MNKLTVMKAALSKRKPLKVSKASGKPSADEPADSLQGSPRANAQGENPAPSKGIGIQGGAYNPRRTPLQDDKTVNYSQSPQPTSAAVNNRGNKGKLKPQGAVYFKKKVRK